MEVTWFSTPEEDTAKSQQDKRHVNCVFWLGRCCPSWVCLSRPNHEEYYLNVLRGLRDATKTATAKGNWWLAASSQQCTLSCIMSCAKFFDETSNHAGESAPLQPRFCALWLLASPKTKITFEREEISDHWWNSGKYNRAADADSNKGFWSVLNSGRDAGRIVWGPKVPTLKGTWGVSYIQCFLYLVSSSINVPFFIAHVGYFPDRH